MMDSELHLSLRRATLEDAERLLAWRNDPASRAASHDTAVVVKGSHLAWLKRVLADPQCRLFVAEVGGTPVGSVRVDWAGDAWLLSWTVAPEARGRGFGRAMVRALAESLDDPLRAEIKAWNAASIRIAEHAGLRLESADEGVLRYSRGPRRPDRELR